MSRPHRLPRSRFPFQVRCAEPLEPRLLLATGPAYLTWNAALAATLWGVVGVTALLRGRQLAPPQLRARTV